jgi:hypothetical protein
VHHKRAQFMEEDAQKPASPSSDNQSSQKKRVVVPHACDQCRSNHVKCDGNMPCFRCVKKKLDCSFKRPNKLVDKGNTSIKCKKNKDHADEGWGPR